MRRSSFLVASLLFLVARFGEVGFAAEGEAVQRGAVLKARLLQRKDEAVPREFFLRAKALRDELKVGGAKLVLVDVRSPKDYAALHLPGALNVPLPAIASKAFLRGKRVVLMNAGHGLRHLVASCRILRNRADMDVKVLAGGVAAWASSGGDLVGTARARLDLRRLSPADYQVDKSFRDVVVVQVGKEGRELFPEAMCFPATTRPDRLRKAIGKVLEPGVGRQALYGVLVVENPRQGGRLMRELTRTGEVPLFLLQGGARGYESYLGRQVAAWTRSPTRKSQRGYLCPSCH